MLHVNIVHQLTERKVQTMLFVEVLGNEDEEGNDG